MKDYKFKMRLALKVPVTVYGGYDSHGEFRVEEVVLDYDYTKLLDFCNRADIHDIEAEAAERWAAGEVE